MKKIIVMSCMLVSLAAAAGAQDFRTWNAFHDGHKDRQSALSRAIDGAVKEMFTPQAEWVSRVKHMVHYVTPREGLRLGPIILDYVDRQVEPEVSANQQAAVTAAKTAWQQALPTDSKYFKNFTFKILRPQDVAALSTEEVNHVAHVLTGALDENPQVEELQHYMVRVTVPGTQPIHLLFNCVTREIYVVRGNAQLPGVPVEPKKKYTI